MGDYFNSLMQIQEEYEALCRQCLYCNEDATKCAIGHDMSNAYLNLECPGFKDEAKPCKKIDRCFGTFGPCESKRCEFYEVCEYFEEDVMDCGD